MDTKQGDLFGCLDADSDIFSPSAKSDDKGLSSPLSGSGAPLSSGSAGDEVGGAGAAVGAAAAGAAAGAASGAGGPAGGSGAAGGVWEDDRPAFMLGGGPAMDSAPESLVDENAADDPFAPLAARLRPRNLNEYIGQSHLIGPGRPLRMALERGQCYSMILWGPPGVGKTTLAFIIARSTNAHLEQISAVTSGIKDIREAVERARQRRARGIRTILFVDEVHRFNKAQQDAFLPHIENGTVIFIGATTENPSFQVNSALLSRARVYVLKKLTDEELSALIDLALTSERGLADLNLTFDDRVRHAIMELSGGDARHLLTTLEMLSDDAAPLPDGRKVITYAMVGAVAGRRIISYDKGGDNFYDLISAFHKSVRGSAPDAALYWYARILEAGGDPLYVARRLLAVATEDIGLADPQAMQIGLNAWDIYTRVGEAEGARAIAQAAVYMALAPKSNHLYTAFGKARSDASKLPSFEVPLYIRNAPTALMESLGYHKGYRYAHDYQGAYAPGECFMPEELHGRTYYEPSNRGYEEYLSRRRDYLKQLDAMAPPAEQRFPPGHDRQMLDKLRMMHPDLFSDSDDRNEHH